MGNAPVIGQLYGIALSVRQPWAWLIVNGHKAPENRTWYTKHRGETIIHAGKKFDMDGYNWVRGNFPQINMPAPGEFDRGGLVGKAYLEDVVDRSSDLFFTGPLAFVFKDPSPWTFIPCRGKLGFFKVSV